MEIFIIVFLLLFLALAYYRLDWAMLVIVAGLPAYLVRFNILGLPGNLLEAMIGIAFLVWAIRYTDLLKFVKREYKIRDIKKRRQERLRYPFGVELVLVLVVALAAAGVAGFKPEALGSWRAYFFVPALFFILVLNLFQSGKKREQLVWALVVSCLGLSVYAIIQKFTGIGIANEMWRAEATRRVTSVFPYPNALALYLAPLSFVFLGYLSVLVRKLFGHWRNGDIQGFGLGNYAKTTLLGLTILLSLVSIYFARSEGALFAWAVSLLAFWWLLKGKWRWFAYGVVAGAAILLIFNPSPRDYLMEKITLTDFSGEVRKQQWRETWEMLKDDRLLTGSGLHNYKEVIEPYHQPGIFFNKDKDPDFRRKIVLFDEEYKEKFWRPVEIYLYPHNIFLNFWTELGFVGMVLFVWILMKFLYSGFKNLRSVEDPEKNNFKYLNAALLGAMMVIIVHGLVDVPYFKNDLAVIFWLLLALMGLISVELRKQDYVIKKIGNHDKS